MHLETKTNFSIIFRYDYFSILHAPRVLDLGPINITKKGAYFSLKFNTYTPKILFRYNLSKLTTI